jgi:hypothetical protein
MESYKFDGGEISIIQDNVLLIEYEIGKLITTRNLFELKKLREKLLGNRKYHSLTDARDGLLNLSDEAKAYIAEENQSSRSRLSDAVIVNSFAKKIEIDLYIRFNKPTVKTKVFTDLNKALCWIESISLEKVEMV